LKAADRRGPVLAVAIGLLLSACSAGTGTSAAPSSPEGQYPGWPGSGTMVGNSDLIPLLVNSELAVGSQRIMVELQDGAGRSLTSADLAVQIGIYDLALSTRIAVGAAPGTFRWLIPDTKAIYTAPATFTHAGDWGMEVSATGGGQPDRTARVTFSVRDTTTTPALGTDAPPSDTLTATDPATLPAISTDAHPDLAFYRLSIKDAIAAGKPFVLVFATPLLCTSGTCGPALDLVKQVAPDYAGRVNFIHVEPYVLQVRDGQTQPEVDLTGQRKPVRAVVEWGLPTEPYVFVVDANGKVTAKFEGLAYPDELTAALNALLP
jgi:hypothetical protein